jgi:hypothetical protein
LVCLSIAKAPEPMPLWELGWCFYNSSAFKPAATVVLLGTIALVIPTLFNLPPKHTAALGMRQTPTIDFNDAKHKTVCIGVLTILLSVIPPLLYLVLLAMASGKTCAVEGSTPKGANTYIVLLFLATVTVLLLFGWFYFQWQDALRKYESLPK